METSEPLPIDASDWDGDEGIATPRAGGLDGIAGFVRDRLVSMVEDARDSLASQVRGLKTVADLVADNVGDLPEPVGRLVGQATGTIDAIADALEEKSVEELVEDGRALVQAQPAAAVGVAIAIGFLAGRMLKAAQD